MKLCLRLPRLPFPPPLPFPFPILLLFSLLLVPPPRTPAADYYQAAAVKLDITPSTPLRLGGYGDRSLPADGVEGKLYARVLCLKDADGVLFLLIAVDSIGIPHWLREDVCGAIRGRLGIYRARTAITSTRTHCAPCLTGLIPEACELTPAELKAIEVYGGVVARRIVEAIKLAIDRLAPAKLLYGKGSAAFARSRREGGAAADHELPVLAILDPSGKLLAVVFNYACPGATLPSSFNRVCGDWPGYAAGILEEAHAGAVALPLIGCGAGARPEPQGRLAHAIEHGHEAAAVVEKVLASPMTAVEGRIDAQIDYSPLRARRSSGEEETYSYPLQVWSFGSDFLMLFLAGEAGADYAVRLRRELAPRRVWVAAYANDLPGYVWDSPVDENLIARALAMARASGPEAMAARLKPPPALSPKEALATLRAAPGFRVELAAAEPEVTDPVAIAFDESERLYAAEMRDYPLGPGEGKPFDGRVRLLEDADGDGYYERSSILADNVPYPNGIASWRGGVFVTAAPDILYLKDNDGDGRTDVRQVVYTGFNLGNSQHLLNSMALGLDGWIYVNGGDYASIRSPANPAVVELKLAHSNFRFQPDTLAIEPTAGYRGGFGIAFDRHGERFLCDNTDHAQHAVLQSRYLGRNPDQRIGATVHDMNDHGGAVYPISKPLERFNDPWHKGQFSSACGVHVYTGDQFPPEYQGSFFVCEPVSNLVHRDILAPAGATFAARRAGKESEFLASTDPWFRPVNCATGPDGALYIADMYREVIEHPEWIPAHVQRLFDLRSGMDRGRIYRVVHGESGGLKDKRRPALAGARAADLVNDLGSANGWRRLTAQRLLFQCRDAEMRVALPLLEEALRGGKEPLARFHALWTLAGLGGLIADHAASAMTDSYPALRAAGARLAEDFLAGDPRKRDPKWGEVYERLRGAMLPLAADPDPHVRFQAALSFGFLAPADREEPLARIALKDAADPWTRTAILTSLTGGAVPVLAALIPAGPADGGRQALIREVSNLIGTRGDAKEIGSAVILLGEAEGTWQLPSFRDLLEPLKPAGVARMLADEGEGSAKLRQSLGALFGRVAERAKDEGADLGERVAAVDLLGHDESEAALSILIPLIEPRFPQELQAAAVRSLARLSSAELRRQSTARLVRAFAVLSPTVRGEVLDAFLQDAERTVALLAALESGEIEALAVDLNRRKKLLESGDEAVRKRAAEVFRELRPDPDRAAVVERYRQALAAPALAGGGNAARGKELYRKHCASCHQIGDEGWPVGADLATLQSRAADALILDILDPSRAIDPRFTNYAVIKRDGTLQNGVITSETPSSIVLRRGEGKSDTILRRDIAELRSTPESLMPAGLEKEISPEDLRDLIAFLKG